MQSPTRPSDFEGSTAAIVAVYIVKLAVRGWCPRFENRPFEPGFLPTQEAECPLLLYDPNGNLIDWSSFEESHSCQLSEIELKVLRKMQIGETQTFEIPSKSIFHEFRYALITLGMNTRVDILNIVS